jgi:hypothetical protein
VNGTKTRNITTISTIPTENLKNCTNYENEIAPGIDESTLETLKKKNYS